MFSELMKTMQEEIHENAVNHGWWEEERSFGELVVLCHCELSEAIEGHRDHNPPDKHCPDFGNVEIELADCVIRIMDLCEHSGIDLGKAIEAKHAANIGRSYKHGGKLI